MSKLYLGVDLGGTKIAAGIVDENGNIICKQSIRTNLPKPMNIIEEDIYGLCFDLCQNNGYNLKTDITSVGVGTPGSVNSKEGVVKANVNFGYENWHLSENLKNLFCLPIHIENDANAAVVAEVTAGSAKGVKDAIIVTLGTGVGGGIVINGKVFTGYNFYGTEIGHMVIQFNGRPCNCGRNGCFEKYASASALTLDTKDAMVKDENSLLWDICPDINKVNAKTAFDAMKKGDVTATKVVNEYIEYLACGITNLINIFQPQVICIGGGVSNENEFLLAPLRKLVDKEDFARNTNTRTKIVTAKFRNDAGIIGAALLGVNNA